MPRSCRRKTSINSSQRRNLGCYICGELGFRSMRALRHHHADAHRDDGPPIAIPLRNAPSTRGPLHQSPQAPIRSSESNKQRSSRGSGGIANRQRWAVAKLGSRLVAPVTCQKASISCGKTAEASSSMWRSVQSGEACKTQHASRPALTSEWASRPGLVSFRAIQNRSDSCTNAASKAKSGASSNASIAAQQPLILVAIAFSCRCGTQARSRRPRSCDRRASRSCGRA